MKRLFVVVLSLALLRTIATGDQFVASEEYVQRLQRDFDAIACEMEGASVAAVCSEYRVPLCGDPGNVGQGGRERPRDF